MANFTALAAARHHVLRDAGWDVEADGLIGAPPISVVASEEAHYTISTSVRLLGLGANRVHRIPADSQGRMRADALAAVLRGHQGPCIVCAQAGNVNTGAFDPLSEIAECAKNSGAWLHVDAAYGGYFILAARALVLDCGPMSGFNNAGVDKEFFPEGTVKSNFLCNLGYGVPEALFPRSPRLSFDEACKII